jgi:hypothetical protein
MPNIGTSLLPPQSMGMKDVKQPDFVSFKGEPNNACKACGAWAKRECKDWSSTWELI